MGNVLMMFAAFSTILVANLNIVGGLDICHKMMTSVSLETDELLQYPELPTGCESVALTILLKYYGFTELEKTTIVDEYLPYNDNFAIGFSGNPYEESGAGCYAPGITFAANNFLDNSDSLMNAKDITGSSKETLYGYVSQGKPVLVWNTIHFSDSNPSGIYVSYEGKDYEWNYSEHCVVLTGFDKEKGIVEVNDPLEGKIERDADRFWQLYEEMGSMAVVIE